MHGNIYEKQTDCFFISFNYKLNEKYLPLSDSFAVNYT